MSNPPQTFSVKRKRQDAPVDTLVFDNDSKRQRTKALNFKYRRLTKPNDASQQYSEPATPTGDRRFGPLPTQGRRGHVLAELRQAEQEQKSVENAQQQVQVQDPVPQATPRPRKRPGAGSALLATPNNSTPQKTLSAQPSEQDLRELEAFSRQVEKEDNLHIPLTSPSKYKPKAPAQRFAQRHPDKAAALKAASEHADGDAMDVDTDEYVYDTYVRETILPDADGKLPEPTGTVGFLMIREDDEDWWNTDADSDKEFDTDEDDENAEDYYANDYPEDELDEDDEYDRNLYQKKYRHGSDDEEYNIEDDNDAVIDSGEDEDDLHFKMTVPKAQRAGYWGAVGEA
ncbi:hypothetical protein GQ44DRAFT_618428 [Phaeosphaeriaceae sp. PMI808]|nr:hypothetical protein GQ44DRAFT_618428 [Phaeosphaeriaceae sp. PMI808]